MTRTVGLGPTGEVTLRTPAPLPDSVTLARRNVIRLGRATRMAPGALGTSPVVWPGRGAYGLRRDWDTTFGEDGAEPINFPGPIYAYTSRRTVLWRIGSWTRPALL